MNNTVKEGATIVLLAGGDKYQLLKMLINEKENIVSVILPYSKAREERYSKLKLLAEEFKIPVLRPSKNKLAEVLSALNPELLISAGYPHLLDAEILNLPGVKINIHPTLLPKYRGPASAWYVIANGETESGVTVHLIDEGMDTGKIVYQEKINLTLFDTTNSLMRKTQQIEPQVLRQAIKCLRSPDFQPKDQSETNATIYTGFRKPEDSLVDASRSIEELFNFIRACDPDRFPAFFILDGHKIGIKLFRLNKPDNEADLL